MTAPHKFTLADNKFGDENTHTCSVQSDKLFSDLPKSDHIFDKAVDQIRTVLRAYQVQFGEEIKKASDVKSRAIYSCDIQVSSDMLEQQILSFGFLPSDNVDYNQAFKALFFDECVNMRAIWLFLSKLK